MIEEPRGRIDYAECGTGPTIVLVPGSCSTGAASRPVIATWNGQFRCVTSDCRQNLGDLRPIACA